MANIKIKNLRKEKPKNPWDVRVCRPSSLGNPFYLDNVFDNIKRDKVCDEYEKWFNKNIIGLTPELKRLLDIYLEYNKLNLFCWCVPKRCHAETIQRWLEKEDDLEDEM